MALGIVGQKCGMTRLFLPLGDSIPVTVIEAPPNKVTQIKTPDKDGYHAIQVTFSEQKPKRINKPISGHFAKAGVKPGRGLVEFRLDDINDPINKMTLGSEIDVTQFVSGQPVDVTGITRGHGFTGVIKRYHFRTQDASHGNSLSHRAPGSIGQNQSPGRVFKGKKMAGRDGNKQRTVQNLTVMRVDAERHLLLIKGAVPGAPRGRVIVRPAKKKSASQSILEGR